MSCPSKVADMTKRIDAVVAPAKAVRPSPLSREYSKLDDLRRDMFDAVDGLGKQAGPLLKIKEMFNEWRRKKKEEAAAAAEAKRLAEEELAAKVEEPKQAAERRRQPKLKHLLRAKAHSDKGNYPAKHQIMRGLISTSPDEFVIDSEQGGFVGVTHVPTGFRMHLPAGAIGDVQLQRVKAASTRLARHALMGAGALGLGAGAYALMPPELGADTSNWRVWRARMALKEALLKLKVAPDVEMETGLHRVRIPRSKFRPNELPYAGFKPSLLAVPEQGQESITTWRNPENYAHLHRHKRNWYLHKDVHPSVTMALGKVVAKHGVTLKDTLVQVADALRGGAKHLFTEGVPGMASYVKNVYHGAPAMEDRPSTSISKMWDSTKNALIPLEVEGKQASVAVEIAEGPWAEMRGLAGRISLPDNHGMLFKRADGFWMRGVNFDLDILFMDKSGKVLDIQTMTKLSEGDFPAVYTPMAYNASLALEVPAGWAARNGVTVGDKVVTGSLDKAAQLKDPVRAVGKMLYRVWPAPWLEKATQDPGMRAKYYKFMRRLALRKRQSDKTLATLWQRSLDLDALHSLPISLPPDPATAATTRIASRYKVIEPIKPTSAEVQRLMSQGRLVSKLPPELMRHPKLMPKPVHAEPMPDITRPIRPPRRLK